MPDPDKPGLTPDELAHARSTALLIFGPVPDDMPGGATFLTRHDGQEVVAAVVRRLVNRLHPEADT